MLTASALMLAPLHIMCNASQVFHECVFADELYIITSSYHELFINILLIAPLNSSNTIEHKIYESC